MSDPQLSAKRAFIVELATMGVLTLFMILMAWVLK